MYFAAKYAVGSFNHNRMTTLAGFPFCVVGQAGNYRCPTSKTTCCWVVCDLHLQPHSKALSGNDDHPYPCYTAVLWMSASCTWVFQIRLVSQIFSLLTSLQLLSQFSPLTWPLSLVLGFFFLSPTLLKEECS